ncbi:MAG: Flp pilus assembly protein CpaB [Planctomycetota bacterium]
MKGSLVLVIAIVVGAIAAVLVRGQIQNAREDIKSDWEPVPVCVAADDLPEGARIDAERDIKMMNVPKSVASIPDYVEWSKRNSLQDQTVGTRIGSGKIIDRRFLGRKDGESSGAQGLEPSRSRRLVAVKVNEVTGTAGHLRPHDKVDVLLTDQDTVTTVILQNMTVMHTGRPQRGPDSRSGNYSTVTLEATLAESMLLTNASSSGTLTLVKRPGASSEIVPTSEIPPIKAGARTATPNP